MKLGRLVIATVFAVAIGGGSAQAADLPVYPGASVAPRPGSVVNHCGHEVTEAHYTIGSASPNAVLDWYAQRIPGNVRVTITMAKDTQTQAVYDPSGTHAASVFGRLLTLLTYNPPIGTAGVAVIRRAGAGDKAAFNQLAHCSAH